MLELASLKVHKMKSTDEEIGFILDQDTVQENLLQDYV